MPHKSIQYTVKCALLAFVFCETLLISATAKPLTPQITKKWVVVIDAGHGGKDPGCHGVKYNEKDVALAVALKLGHLLEANDDNVKVIYTRTTDVFIPLNERAEIANRNHADFFICVHCNASPDKTKYGAATYVMGLYKSEGNLEVSKRENSSVLYEKNYKQTYNGFDPNSDEGNILFAMYQNAYLAQSLDLSTKIQKEYSGQAGRTDNGVKQAGFLVLWKTTMPSLLTEIGFLTNPEEESFIGSQKGQNKIAQCLFFALQQYIDEKEGTTFNADDFKLAPTKSDSIPVKSTTVETPDTSAKVAPIDTIKAVVVKPQPTPVKQIKATTPKDADKMKASLKILHPDTTANVAEKQAPDTTTHKAIKSIVDTTANKPIKKSPDLTAHKTVKLTVDSTTHKSIKIAADSTKIIYKVQIVLSPKPLEMSDARFNNVQDVEMYIDKGMYKYTSGHFTTLDEAVRLQAKLRAQGFKDCFVVAFKGKNRVPIVKGK
jgi:N-acetylmuramoyl-L-alanine amidase